MGIIGIKRQDLGKRQSPDRDAIKDAPPVKLGPLGRDLLRSGAAWTDGTDVYHVFADISYTDGVRQQVVAQHPELVAWDVIPDGWSPHQAQPEGWPVLNVLDYGVKNDATPNDPALAVAMIEDALTRVTGFSGGVELYWPPGDYLFTGPIVVAREGYEFYKLRLRGAGKDQTRIRTGSDLVDLFRFTNTGGFYSAQLSFHGIQFAGGNTGLYIDNPFYGEIVDCGFRNLGRNGGFGIHLAGNATMFRLVNCWFFHTDNILHSVGFTQMLGCDIGEDAGGVMVRDSAQFIGCRWHGTSYFNNPPAGETEAAIVVAYGGSAHIVGCTAIRRNGRPFVQVDMPGNVAIQDCYIWNYGASPIVSSDRIGNGVSISGGSFVTIADAPIWSKHGAHQETIRNSSITDLRIIDQNDSVITVPDDFFDPDNRNIYEGNQVAS